jgi:hypothetical protein
MVGQELQLLLAYCHPPQGMVSGGLHLTSTHINEHANIPAVLEKPRQSILLGEYNDKNASVTTIQGSLNPLVHAESQKWLRWRTLQSGMLWMLKKEL